MKPIVGACSECGRPLVLEVVRYGQGYAVGSACESCGPESVETRSMSLREAEKALKAILKGGGQHARVADGR